MSVYQYENVPCVYSAVAFTVEPASNKNISMKMCDISAAGKMSDCQPEGPGFNSRPGRGLNFGRPSFATPSVDRGVKPLL